MQTEPLNLTAGCSVALLLIMSLSSVVILILGSGAALVGLYWLGKYLLASRSGHPIVDKTQLTAAEGYTALTAHNASLVGKTGTAQTDLKPNGFVLIEGERYDAQTRGELVERGGTVKVVGTEGNFLLVRPQEQPPA